MTLKVGPGPSRRIGSALAGQGKTCAMLFIHEKDAYNRFRENQTAFDSSTGVESLGRRERMMADSADVEGDSAVMLDRQTGHCAGLR